MSNRLTQLFSLVILVMAACSPGSYDRLTVSTLNWIGYTPLFYAKSQGWLDEYNIDLIHVVSLSENMYLFEAGNTDAFLGTQYEYGVLSRDMADLLPIVMLDRSNGGDVVLGNLELEQYQHAEVIDVYLEIDSVNQLVLNDFAVMAGLDRSRLRVINSDPGVMSLLNPIDLTAPTLIVTYNPYEIILRRRGFHELASTSDGLDLLVVDAMYTRRATLDNHREQFDALKAMIDIGVEKVIADPQVVYEAIKPYLQDISFAEFLEAMGKVEWINTDMNAAVAARLHELNFPTSALLPSH